MEGRTARVRRALLLVAALALASMTLFVAFGRGPGGWTGGGEDQGEEEADAGRSASSGRSGVSDPAAGEGHAGSSDPGGGGRDSRDLAGAIDVATAAGLDWQGVVLPLLLELRGQGAAGLPGWTALLGASSDVRLRRVAAEEIGRLGREEGIASLARAASGDADEAVRVASAAAIGTIGGRRAAGELARLLASSPDEWVRVEAAGGLARSVAPEDGPVLVDLFLAEPQDGVRAGLVAAIARTGDADAARRLAGALAEGRLDPTGRMRALELLARLGAPVPVEVLLAEIRGGPPIVQRAALDALAAVAREESYPHLRGVYESERDLELRTWALEAMSRLGPGPAADHLERVARDAGAPPELRAAAVLFLSNSQGSAYLPLYEELSVDSTPEVLRSVARSCAETCR
ncbi:MAG: HEAT repeat domain-containing protein [Planctomycetes bacterium]|nr:HEAT repeat domain-containing protein [Planctomycetota bacterium]